MLSLLLVFGAGLLAGAMNAAAGGGSFVTIPALVFAGMPSVAANASSTVALLPGTLASAWAWRQEFRSFEGIPLPWLIGISFAGGLAGAVLLLATPQRAFDDLLPWLLLTGTLAFAFGRQLGEALRRHVRIGRGTVLAAQIVLAIYAGYFGGGVGIMMMAVWSLLGHADIRAMSAARTLLVSAANAVAVLCFALWGPVRWPETLVMLVAAVIGGYGGAVLARRLPAPVLRAFVIVFGLAMTAVFFLRR
ncbi:sulfite exporter TauE/SafE family protein [Paracraurococcus lichenis]|uniref:Probable membrane transporter protein n=1 Tax=Paracraurococcus lichenis TaxID=3064888 RepID=A0ABT9DTW6_9PROT|nr:sulfite exporter TauE/SafE family protein [Paracraurococcus sp. LOR1-02]MDO9707348.1 sulfite exporter TauE/SafE family protein [Paracraurococcus sp. LOR1-02]